MLEFWPFFLLIAVFVGFSVYMARVLGTGSSGSNYLKLMEAQVVVMKEQADAQKLLVEELRLQTAAIERLASAVEDHSG